MMLTVDNYLAQQSQNVRTVLTILRQLIMTTCPEAVENIAYGMPAYKYHGKPLVYFGAFANHIGFYATPRVHEAFAVALSSYKHGKGSVQFLLDTPLPRDLIRQMVEYRKWELTK